VSLAQPLAGSSWTPSTSRAAHLLRGSEAWFPMAPMEQQQVDGSLLASISRAVVRIVHEYTGRGPTKARTSIRDDIVVVMLQESLLKAEQSLIRDGKADQVVDMRRSFQQTMREDLCSAVEMLTERKVIAFMSDSHLEPDYSAELFVLAPVDA
jgi:uncharacterized protein YbcI